MEFTFLMHLLEIVDRTLNERFLLFFDGKKITWLTNPSERRNKIDIRGKGIESFPSDP